MIKEIFLSLFVALSFVGSSRNSFASPQAIPTFTTRGSQILKDGVPFEWRGVNAMHEFGGDGSDTTKWPTIDIVRETMLHMAAQPIEGPPVVISGKNIASLQTVVDNNRSRGQITLLSAHAWDVSDTSHDTSFQGHNPQEAPWWEEYKTRYRAIAEHFKDQPDVWFGVWNEPYSWQGARGYSDALWLRDMAAMIDNIRSTGAQNIILVPGSHSGQGEQVLLNEGRALLKHHRNIVFEVHAYERWLGRPNDAMWPMFTQAQIESRLQALLDAKLPVIFDEYGAYNNNWLASVEPFLNACRNKHITTTAWGWQAGPNKNALHTTDYSPNDSEQNNNYGSFVKDYLAEPRNIPRK